ncbi:DUF2141 domain-containing protein [Tunturibacter empetritectus]|uniref:Uncharacterized protein (DUF2141 family) n=1 Tax=Tunturiibacter empetritectus TaxID=3069691 RepID=A0A7W8IIJ0_9BACT|nr:DUF2141 domain-containing protein [Edaphobacter lichenicola]MBB5317791.1 uncharacterized protein (DUF2141 family) [Edaphobacter lichenicola]
MMLANVLTFVLIVLTGAASSVPAVENVIHVDVEGLRSSKGQVMCALYSSAEGFPKNGDKALAHTSSPVSNGNGVCDFRGILPGRYAIAVYHDENSNGRLDTNFVGMPREGVGASNNAKGHFGPPKFDDAAFGFTGGRVELKIAVTYL